jgi:hypothetical protein
MQPQIASWVENHPTPISARSVCTADRLLAAIAAAEETGTELLLPSTQEKIIRHLLQNKGEASYKTLQEATGGSYPYTHKILSALVLKRWLSQGFGSGTWSLTQSGREGLSALLPATPRTKPPGACRGLGLTLRQILAILLAPGISSLDSKFPGHSEASINRAWLSHFTDRLPLQRYRLTHAHARGLITITIDFYSGQYLYHATEDFLFLVAGYNKIRNLPDPTVFPLR